MFISVLNIVGKQGLTFPISSYLLTIKERVCVICVNLLIGFRTVNDIYAASISGFHAAQILCQSN